MPNSYILNQRFSVVPTTYGPIVSMLVEFLVSAGWTYKGSGGGSGGGFSATGKTFVGTGSGANGWGNSGAWARIQDPGGGREFLIQHNNSAGASIRYSASAKFIGSANGAPSATIAPTATDEKFLRGQTPSSYGSNFFPNISTSTTPNITGVIWQGAALSTAPYGFWFACQMVGTHLRLTSMMMDPVVSDPADPDPVVIVIGDADITATGAMSNGLAYAQPASGWSTLVASMASPLTPTSASQSNGISGNVTGAFAHMDVAKTCFLPVRAMGYMTGAQVSFSPQNHISGKLEPPLSTGSTLPQDLLISINPGGLGVNPFNGKPEYLPVLWSRIQTAGVIVNWVLGTTDHNMYIGAIKGWSTMCRWTCLNRTSFMDTTDNKNKICVGAWWLPWDGVTTPRF